MAIPRNVEEQLTGPDFEALEDAWLARMAEGPADLDSFLEVAARLDEQGESERTRLLLQLLADHLDEAGRWRQRLELLRRAGAVLLPAPIDRHAAIVASLERLHAERPSFAALAEYVGLHRAPEDVSKTWQKVERLEGLLAVDVGTVVWMEGKGVGRVTALNLELESFRLDLERQTGLLVGLRAASKLIHPLPPDHVLRLKLERPEALAGLVAGDPAELLRRVLVSYDRPLTAAEIREVLAGVVGEAEWTAWWAAARRHPQVVTSSAGRQVYTWGASAGEVSDDAWDLFMAAGVEERLDLYRRHSARDPVLRRRMATALASVAGKAASAPATAFRVAMALERGGEAAGPTPSELVAGSPDLAALLAGLEERATRERAYRLARATRTDWRERFAERLPREEDPRLLDLLVAELGGTASEAVGAFLDGVFAQARRLPAVFAWLAERAGEDETILARSPLRLLQRLLETRSEPAFRPCRTRLTPLFESGGTVPRLLGRLAEGEAPAAAEAIQRARLPVHDRDALLNALHMRFPFLRQPAENPLYALPETIAARRSELRRLKEEEIPANRRAIQEARELGDLRENFEYKAARQRHEYLSARVAGLERDLSRVRPLEAEGPDGSEIRIGSQIELGGDGRRRALTILGPWESDPEAGVVSYESELGQALLGKRAGEEVILDGVSFRILEVGRGLSG